MTNQSAATIEHLAQLAGFDQALATLYDEARRYRAKLEALRGTDEFTRYSSHYVSTSRLIEKLEARRVELFGAKSGMTDRIEQGSAVA